MSAAIHADGVADRVADAVTGKRPYHAFLSHAHVDKAQADGLHGFLSRVAGFRVRYDTGDLPPGAAFGTRRYEAMEVAAL